MRVSGFPQYEPIASARSKSGRIRTRRSSARGAGPSASRRCRSRRSSSSGLTAGDYRGVPPRILPSGREASSTGRHERH